MNWESDELRAAALRLLLGGNLRRTLSCADLVDQLDDAGLVLPTRRRDEYVLNPRRTDEYRRYLGARWPGYAEVALAFTGRAGELSVAALHALRRADLPAPTGRTLLNRKTWAAWASAHSKATEAPHPEGVTLTSDDVLRMRVNDGLVLRSAEGREQDLASLQALATEVVLPERSFGRHWTLTGQLPVLAVTVENQGAFVDAPLPAGMLLIHAPGWNSGLAGQVMARLPASVAWWHFGDLDPNGLRIGLSMRAAGQPDRQPVLWIPEVASQLLESHSLPRSTPWPLRDVPAHLLSHPTVAWLASRGRWLEQETMVLMPAFEQEFSDAVSRLSRAAS